MPTRSVLRSAVLRLLLLGLCTGALVAPLQAATKKPATVVRHDKLPLHLGSYGPRVVELQKLLDGEKKSVFKEIRPTLKTQPNGLFGQATEEALFALKYRLGYPDRFNHKGRAVAGTDFFSLMYGHSKRTLEMVGWAQIRIQAVEAGSTVLAQQIKRIETSQLGANENLGPNCGTRIDAYFRYFGIGCGLPWCAIFAQWSFARAGYKPPFANRSFGVIYIAQWARDHGYLNAKARVGSLVAFLDDGGHIGYVVKVLASGYVTDEGNSSNRVQQVYHPWSNRLRVFIDLPGVA